MTSCEVRRCQFDSSGALNVTLVHNSQQTSVPPTLQTWTCATPPFPCATDSALTFFCIIRQERDARQRRDDIHVSCYASMQPRDVLRPEGQGRLLVTSTRIVLRMQRHDGPINISHCFRWRLIYVTSLKRRLGSSWSGVLVYTNPTSAQISPTASNEPYVRLG